LFAYHLDKFLVAYGLNLLNVDRIAKSPRSGARLVNQAALATAFHGADSGAPKAFVRILRESAIRVLLELGCGTAPMSRSLARIDKSIVAWAVDMNSDMCTVARSLVASEGLAERVHIRQSTIAKLESVIPKRIRSRVDTLYAQSVMNAFCSHGQAPALELLQGLRRVFPERRLFIVDYFGRLGTRISTKASELHTILQDIVQALSGQGIPPAGHQRWFALYDEAGCRVEGAYEGTDVGVHWFVHHVTL